jgi:hypothetical protein
MKAFFNLNSKSKTDQANSVDIGLQLLKDMSNQLKVEGWQAVFKGVVSPFVQAAFILSDQTPKQSNQTKESHYTELVKSTLKEIYIMLTEEKDNFEIILEFMKTLEQQIVDGEKQLIEIYFHMLFDAIQHKPLTQLSGHMAGLLMTTIRRSIPQIIFDNNLTKLIQEKKLRSDPKLDLDFDEIDPGFNTSETMYRCSVLLEAIKVTNKIVTEHLAHIPASQLKSLVTAVQEAHDFSVQFNQDLLLRYLLFKTGYKSTNPNIPSVYGIERFSADLILKYTSNQAASDRGTEEPKIDSTLK